MPCLTTLSRPKGSHISKVDFVLGDRFGKACSFVITKKVENILEQASLPRPQ